MAESELSLRHIRIVTKERPHDRFLTAQARDIGRDKEDGQGALFFVVEITNPWFPNSQIGQTIINTVIREFKRGEYSSPLQNFEIALRKTNEVLANITQSGETDWIGNLSSVIALSSGPHLYLAQTGKARAYLIRGGKIADITEGLEPDADHHPLTTYTNITSGSLEPNDRLLMASSLLPETLSQAELKTLFQATTLPDAVAELIRNLHQHRVRRVHGFAIEAIAGPNTTEPETMYADQSPSHPLATAKKAWRQHIMPSLARGSQQARATTAKGSQWVKDWLIPKLLDWSRTGARQIKRQSQTLVSQAQSRLPRPAAVANTTSKLKSSSTSGPNVQIHHYTDTRRRSKLPITLPLPTGLRMPKFPKFTIPALPFIRTNRQRITLGVALLALVIVMTSVTLRRGAQQTEQQQTNASAALETAKAAQVAAERAFVLGQKEVAKTNFLVALTAAQDATTSTTPAIAEEAKTILVQSQNLFDQLINATRFSADTPIATLEEKPGAILEHADRYLALIGRDVFSGNTSGEQLTRTGSFTAEPITGNTDTTIGNDWLLPTESGILRYNPETSEVSTPSLASGQWPTTPNLGSFGTSLYVLDTQAGQIWKHTASGSNFNEAKPYFATANTSLLAGALDFAIDGDVFILNNDGTINKYTRGVLQTDWSLKDTPTPWSTVDTPKALFTTEAASKIYIYEEKTTDRPARILEFAKDGAFTRQLLLPTDWTISALSWNSETATGLAAVGSSIFVISWSE